MDEPPYLRIVAGLRQQIADGHLAPGDRLPSIRRIAKDWGVALATATKALTVLREQGVVHARPRVGTVVAAPPAVALPHHTGSHLGAHEQDKYTTN